MKERYDVFSCAHQVRMPTIIKIMKFEDIMNKYVFC